MVYTKEEKRVYDKEYRKKNRDKLSEQRKHWASRNPDKQRGYQRRYLQRYPEALERRKEWRRNHPEVSKRYRERHPDKMKDMTLRANYGIGLDDLHKLIETQDGKCAVCGRIRSDLGVDHNHKNGIVRGLLCGPCNRAEGLLKTSTVAGRLAIYMRKWE